MGLSSSSTKQTTNQTQNSNQTENATTTPVTPDWLTQAAQDYVGRIGSFGDMDPNSFVAPASPLQQMAWQNAPSLGDWRAQTATASQMAQQAGSGGPNYAGLGGATGQWSGTSGLSPSPQPSGGPAQMSAKFSGTGPQPTSELARPAGSPQPNPFSGASSQGPAYTYQAPTVSNPGTPMVYGAQHATLGAPALVSGAGYSVPQLGNAQGYAAARVGAPIGATAATYQAPTVGNAPTISGAGYDASQVTVPTIGSVPGATATDASAGSIYGNLNQFQNPYQQQVIDASLADFDHEAQVQQAQLEAQGAASGALGGSRFGIAQGELLADQGRSRAQLDAGLRSQGFDTAANLAGQQAGFDQSANLFNAQNQTGISQFNSGQGATLAQAQAGLDLQGGVANQQALDAAGQFGAQSRYDAGLANAQLGASRDQLQAQLQAQAAGQNASALTQNSQFNAGQGLQAALAQAGLDTDAAKYGADMGNQFALQQAGLNANALQFGAANAQQAALANQNLAGQYGLAQFGSDSAANAAYAAALNQAGLTGYQGALSSAQLQAQLAAAAGQYNAGANNQMSQFNATQADNDANRQLQAAQLLGGLANDYGAGTRADLATMGQLGDQQRAIEQAYAMAGPAQLQLMGQLSGMTPYQILVGQNVNGNTTGTATGTGTVTTVQNPSLFSQLLAGASLVPQSVFKSIGG